MPLVPFEPFRGVEDLEKQEDVHIHVEHNTLTVHGQINRSSDFDENRMHRRERFTGRFQRSVQLPAQVKADGTSATYRNGILEVRMPKAQDETKKRIDVQFH